VLADEISYEDILLVDFPMENSDEARVRGKLEPEKSKQTQGSIGR